MFGAVSAALDGYFLAAWPDTAPPVAWEGVAYSPTSGKPFIDVKLSGYTREPQGPGSRSLYLESGVYTITVKWPSGQGRAPAALLADEIVRLFPRGQSIAVPGQPEISILSAAASPGVDDGSWICVPVLISWMTNDADL